MEVFLREENRGSKLAMLFAKVFVSFFSFISNVGKSLG